MRRIALTVTVAFASALAGCSDSGNPSPSPSPAITPSPVANGVTPGAMTLEPGNVAEAALVALPASGGNPADCPAIAAANTACFGAPPAEIDPKQPGNADAYTQKSANETVAVVGPCAGGTVACVSPVAFLVYGLHAGRTVVTVTGISGATASLPVSVTESDATVTLSRLPAADRVVIAYRTNRGKSGTLTDYQAVKGERPQLRLDNLPLPVDVPLTVRALVLDSKQKQIAVATLRGVVIHAGRVNALAFAVSPATS